MTALEKAGIENPVQFIKALWPWVYLYDKQIEVVESVWNNYETICVAGNMLGKDFITGLIVLTFFLTRHPVRVVTTSADYAQLESVLWGEIRRFLYTARIPLTSDKGGRIVDNHLYLKKMIPDPQNPTKLIECGLSYCIGRVAKKGEGLLGHHIADTGDGIPRTLFAGDEASGLDDEARERATTWARRMMFIGNPYTCNNFFYKGVKAGDMVVKRS